MKKLVLLPFFLMGCSHFQSEGPQAPRSFSFDRVWARDTLSKDHLGYRKMHRMEPLLTEDLVIQGNAIDGIKAYDRNSGRQRWVLNIPKGVEGGGEILEGKLYFGASDGQFYCVEAQDGQVVWTYPLKAEGLAKPLIDGKIVYVLGGNNVLHALDRSTGKLVWTYNRQEVSSLSIRGGSTPAADPQNLYVGFSDGYLVSLNKQTGALKWETLINRNQRFRDVDASPVIYEDRILVPSYDGGLYSLDRTSGKILWNYEGGGSTGVAIDKGQLYYGSSQNEVVALDISSGQKIWSYPLKGLPTEPKLYRGLVLVGDSLGPVYALDSRTGELQNSFHPGIGVTSSLVIDDEASQAFFISADANLFALRLQWLQAVRQWPWEKL